MGDEATTVDGAWGTKPGRWIGRGSEKPGRWIGRGGWIAWLSCLPGLALIFKYKDS